MKWFLLVALLSVPALAHADVVPPESTACEFRKEGAACAFQSMGGVDYEGMCVPGTCSRLDYEHWTDAGMPGSVTWACLKCSPQDSAAGGCSLAGSTPGELGALAIAGSFSLLFLLKRRRA